MSKPRPKRPAAAPEPAEPGPQPTGAAGFPWRAAALVLGLQLVWLVLAAGQNRHLLNNDAIAYLRLAGYYAEGKTELMVSGYWGPLFSWLTACGLKVGLDPLVAGRWVMALSAVVFAGGAMHVAWAAGLRARSVVAMGAVCAVTAVFWSVEYLSPDLLLAGFWCLAWGLLLRPEWVTDRRRQAAVGALLALAYYAKAVAFPLAFAVTLGLAGLHCLTEAAERRVIGRAAGLSLGVFLLLASPWLGVLSVKYGGLTFSTSGRINHAIVGPKDVDRYHPVFTTLHEPQPGRVTQWEDPSVMPYQYWSPGESGGYLRHQLGLLRTNFETVVGHLANFDLFLLGFLSLLGALFVRPPWRQQLAADRWRWLLVPVVCVSGVYLPVWVAPFDERYFYALQPLLLVMSFALLERLAGAWSRGRAWVWWLPAGLLLLSFGLVPLIRAWGAKAGLANPAATQARELAARLRAAGLSGPVAGSGTILGNRAGLYVAYFLDTPWLGDRKEPTAEDYRNSGARLVIVNALDAVAQDLQRDPAFRLWQPPVDGGAGGALAVFERVGATPAR